MTTISAIKLDKAEIVDVYSKTAPIYDLWGRLTETKARQKALAAAQIRNGESILEVAMGTGLTFLEILKANPGGENIGIDLTPAMLKKAQRRASKSGFTNYQLNLGDAYRLQFPDQRFDLLMNNYMFDLLPEKDFPLILAEFKRVLKPDGRLVLVNMTRPEHFYQRIWEGVYHLNPRWLGGCRGVLLSEHLQTAGFKNARREMLSELGFPSEILVARA
jgi:ubiquinone/menaquinone biosynthesis C-methylase UbiE